MFSGCKNLWSLDNSFNILGLSNFNLKKINDMCWMFEGCSSLKKIPDIS